MKRNRAQRPLQRKHVPKDIRWVFDRAQQQGWKVRIRNGGHIEWRSPDRDQRLIFSAATPSDPRSIHNTIRELIRGGLDLEDERSGRC